MRRWSLTALAGAIWLGVAFFLLNLGAGFLFGASESMGAGGHPVMAWLARALGGGEMALMALFLFAFAMGLLKGRTVMVKAANRTIGRICSLPEPSTPLLVYGRSSYILILSMMALGMVMRFAGVPEEVRGTILVAVGIALLNGGIYTLRIAFHLRRRQA